VATASRGAATEWVQATRTAATIPLGAFAELVPEGARSDDRLQLLRGSVEALRERAAGRPLVVGVDDAQLLDAASAALVLHLAATGTAFVVATVRSGEPPPDSVIALWKDAGAARLELQHLSEEETGALLEAVLGGPVEQDVKRWAFSVSEGNALYVRELVTGALEAGALVQDGGWWRLRRRPSVAPALVELISGRMAELSAEERGAIELVALGEPLPLDLVAGITGTAPLAALESRSLITADAPTAGGAIRVAHPLYGEVVREGISTIRAMEVRRSLAAALQEHGLQTPGEALRVATWLHQAGAAVDTSLLLQAAWQATQYGDPDLGAQLAEQAVQAGAGFQAALLLAHAHVVRKDFERAEALLAALEPDIPDRYAALGYIWERGVNVLCWGLKRPDEARALLERAMTWEDGAEDWIRMLGPMRLMVTALTAGWQALVALGEEILDDPELDPESRRQLIYGHAGGLFFVGRTQEAVEVADSVTVPIPLRDDFDDQTLIIQAAVRIESGRDWPLLRARLLELERQAVVADDRAAMGSTALMLAGLSVMRGVPETRWAHEAVARLERRDRAGLLPTAHAISAMLARVAGDREATIDAAARMEVALGGEEPLINQLPYVVAARAAAALAQDDAPGAQQIFLDGVQQFPESPMYRGWFLYEAVRAGAEPRSVLVELERAADETDAPLTRTYARHVNALVAGDAAALAEAAAAFERIGAVGFAGEAAAHAADVSGAPQLTAREREIVALAAEGASNAEIAERLVLSVRTVETHLFRAMKKLGVSSRADLQHQ
jgi:DNA-binding CsgD family transcriptional regulator